MSFRMKVKEFNDGVAFCLNGLGKDKNRPTVDKLHITVGEVCYMESCDGNKMLRYTFSEIYDGEPFDFMLEPTKFDTKDGEDLLFRVDENGDVICERKNGKVTETISNVKDKYFNLNIVKDNAEKQERTPYRFDPKILVKVLRGFVGQDYVDLLAPKERTMPWILKNEGGQLFGIAMPMRIVDDDTTND